MSLPSLILIHGDDEFRVELAAKEMLSTLIPENASEFALDRVDGRVETVSDTLRILRTIRDNLLTVDLFGGGGEKTVWLRDPAFLTNDRISRSEEIKKSIAVLTDQVKAGFPEGSRLLLTTTKINRTTSFYKACVKFGKVVDTGTALNARARNDAATLLCGEVLQKFGLKMSMSVQNAFLARVGTESRRIVSELEKLACYCGKQTKVTAEDISAIVSSGAVSEIWDFTDAFAQRNVTALVKQIKVQLEQGENAIRLVASILPLVNDLLLLRDALDRGWAKAAGRQGVSWDNTPSEVADGLAMGEKDFRSALAGWRGDKMLRNAGLWKTSELRAARHHVLKLREELVSCALPEEYLLTVRLLQAVRR